jgi:hypothetical protein
MSKITNTKRTGGVAQVLEHLPSKREVLSSNRRTAIYLGVYVCPPNVCVDIRKKCYSQVYKLLQCIQSLKKLDTTKNILHN